MTVGVEPMVKCPNCNLQVKPTRDRPNLVAFSFLGIFYAIYWHTRKQNLCPICHKRLD